MQTIEQYALGIVRRLVAEKEAARIVPPVASAHDISRIAIAEISQALERLTAQGVLHKTENINKIPLYHLAQ